MPNRFDADNETDVSTNWLWLLLIVSIAILVFQLFPSAWWAIVYFVDIRNWAWRAYATVCAIGIAVLVAVRAWQNSNESR